MLGLDSAGKAGFLQLLIHICADRVRVDNDIVQIAGLFLLHFMA
jgi:hypothetical protein